MVLWGPQKSSVLFLILRKVGELLSLSLSLSHTHTHTHTHTHSIISTEIKQDQVGLLGKKNLFRKEGAFSPQDLLWVPGSQFKWPLISEEGDEDTREEHSRNNHAALGQHPGSTSRDMHYNIFELFCRYWDPYLVGEVNYTLPTSNARVPGSGRSLCQEDPLEEGTETHSSILAWGISLTEETGGLQLSDLAWHSTQACRYQTSWNQKVDDADSQLPPHQPVARMSTNWPCPPWTINRKLLTIFSEMGQRVLRAWAHCGPVYLGKQ